MSGPSEEVLGELWVSTQLKFGSERIRLLVTSSRIVFDHGGKRGPGAVVGTSILGKLSTGLESLFKSGGESRKKKRMEKHIHSWSLQHIHKHRLRCNSWSAHTHVNMVLDAHTQKWSLSVSSLIITLIKKPGAQSGLCSICYTKFSSAYNVLRRTL